MALVKFLGNLKQYVPEGEVTVSGRITVTDALAAIGAKFESLRSALFREGTTTVHDYHRILVNAEMIEFLPYGMDTCLGPEDIVLVVPPIAGG